ncbi:MAG: tetratricopeptide repeat protein [Alphaproteobacteria bacterium]|nr:tetratricopeptide repeat protein [Alphaproteobacteria bacterium]
MSFLSLRKTLLLSACVMFFPVAGLSAVALAQDDVAVHDISVVIDEISEAAQPDDATLVDSDDASSGVDDASPASRGDGDVFSADDSPSIAGPSGVSSDEFFDAESLVPQGEMAKSTPHKVNPRLQPASKYVLVRKDFAQDTYSAKLVAADRAMKLGRYDSAVDILDSLVKSNSRDPRALMSRAVALQKLGRFDEAMADYEKTEKLDPNNIEVKVNMLGLLGTKFPAVALRRLLDLHESHQDHVGIVAQIAVVEAQLGDFQNAMKYLGMAASMDPDNASHFFNMGVIADRAGETKVAVSYYEKALELDSIYGAGKTIPRDAVYERLAQIR